MKSKEMWFVLFAENTFFCGQDPEAVVFVFLRLGAPAVSRNVYWLPAASGGSFRGLRAWARQFPVTLQVHNLKVQACLYGLESNCAHLSVLSAALSGCELLVWRCALWIGWIFVLVRFLLVAHRVKVEFFPGRR